MRGLLNNIRNKFFCEKNLPILLFLITVINFLPIFFSCATYKGNGNGINSVIKISLLMIEYFLLFTYFLINKKKINISKRKILYLIIVSMILLFVQFFNYFLGKMYINDILNVCVFFTNVLLFYIFFDNYKIQQQYIVSFYRIIISFAVLSIVWMFVLYNKEILAQIGLINSHYDYSHINNIKGFFSNRAGLSFFILLATISNSILIQIDKKRKIYLLMYPLFFIGIWATHSKTEYLLFSFVLILLIWIDKERKCLNKFFISIFVALISIVGFINVLGYYPNIKERIAYTTNQNKHAYTSNKEKTKTNNKKSSNISKNDNEADEDNFVSSSEDSNTKLNELVVSKSRLLRLSGRVDIWNAAFKFLKKNPYRIIFGVGKFYSTEILQVNGVLYEHFHNLYLEFIMTGGIIELVYIISIFIYIMYRINNSNMSKSCKKVYLISYIMYALISMLETYGKFSIGFYDCLCLVFFVSIPLLHANIKKGENDKYE